MEEAELEGEKLDLREASATLSCPEPEDTEAESTLSPEDEEKLLAQDCASVQVVLKASKDRREGQLSPEPEGTAGSYDVSLRDLGGYS